jgi:hypothetical protein
MSFAEVGARVYMVIDDEVYTASRMANMASAENIPFTVTGNKPHNLNLLSKHFKNKFA